MIPTLGPIAQLVELRTFKPVRTAIACPIYVLSPTDKVSCGCQRCHTEWDRE